MPLKRSKLIKIGFSLFPAIIGFGVILGWIFGYEQIKSVFSGFIKMNPLTAFNFITLGITCCIMHLRKQQRPAILLVLILFSGWTVFSLVFDVLFDPASRLDKQILNAGAEGSKMSPGAILNFVLLTVALGCSYLKRPVTIIVSQVSCLIALYISLMYACAYLFNFGSLTGSSIITPMAIHTTLGLAMLSSSVLALHLHEGLLRHIFAKLLGGKITRKMLPLIIVIPFAVGYARLLGQDAGFYNTELGAAIHVVTISFFCAICLGYYSRFLNKLDIERQSAEDYLRKSENTFSSVFYFSGTGMALVSPEGAWLDVNDALCKMVGYSKDELMKLTFQDITHPGDLNADLKYVNDMLSGRRDRYTMEKRYIHKNGSIVWIMLSVSLVNDEKGAPRFFIAQIVDITSSKRAAADNQRILDASLDVICSFDENGRFTQVSKACKEVWGYEARELLGKRYMDFVHPDYHPITTEIAGKIMGGETFTNFENLYFHKSGRPVPIVWSATWSEEQKTMFCVARDATAQKRLERSLEMERRRLEKILMEAPSCICILEGPDHIYKMANPLYQQVLGKTGILGRPFRQVFPELQNQGFVELLDKVYETGETYVGKEILSKVRKAGTDVMQDFYFDFIYQPYYNEFGAVQGIFVFANDITQQVSAKKKIAESERRYRELIEEMPGAVYTCDADGRLRYYNKAAADLWGREPKIGKEYWCGSHAIFDHQGTSIPLDACPMAMTIKTRTAVRGAELVVSTPGGELRDVQPHPIPLFDAEGNFQGAINMLIDITAHKRAEKELQEQQQDLKTVNNQLQRKNKEAEMARKALVVKAKELEQSNRYKSEFLANMTHELRTPLNSILILAGLLNENTRQNLDEKEVEYARIIRKSGNDLLALINDILDLAKIEAGKLSIFREPTSLAQVAENMKHLFGVVSDQKNITFKVTVADGVPRSIYTDKLRLEQILKNLLSNAFKFTNEGGTVQLQMTMETDGQLAIEVIDSGIGIKADQKHIIFEAFQQANGSTTRKFGGTGLGLSISRELTIMLNGTIEVESEEGKGSKFKLSFKLEEEEEVLPSDSENTNAAELQEGLGAGMEYLAGRKVLIADDDVRNIFALSALLSEYGITFYTAENGLQALEQLESNLDIDLVLLDMMMPEMDGYDTVKRIRKNSHYKDLPVIALTARAMAGEQERCRAAGVSDYITKPFDNRNLMSRIKQLIKK